MSRSMIHVFRFVAALVLLLCAVGQAKANHVIDNSAFQTTIISLGEQDGLPFAESAYFAQTFVSPGGVAKDLTIFIETGSPLPGEVLDDTKFHLLLTGFSGLHPTDVLFESGTIDVAPGGKFPPMPLTIGLANTPLAAGQTFAFVLDTVVTRDGVGDAAALGGNFITNTGNVGQLFSLSNNQSSGNRASDFSTDWSSSPAVSLQFVMTFTPTVVPEPSTLVMSGTAALVGLGLAWRRRARQA